MVSPNKTINIPSVTTADRNANLANAPDGTLIFNTDTVTMQVKKIANWEDVATGAGIFSLQVAYDNGPTINMDSNVDLEVFSSTANLAFSVVEGGATSSVQCLNTLKISYDNVGGPSLVFDHPTVASVGGVVANVGGETQASNAAVKNYQAIQYKVLDNTDPAFQTETIHKNYNSGAEIECFSTGVENKSFRDLNMQNNFITNAGAISANSLNSPNIDVQGGTVTNAGNVESQALVSFVFSQFNQIDQTDPLNNGVLYYNIFNGQTPLNGNVSWECSHQAKNSALGSFTYNIDQLITQNVTAGSESAQRKFYCANSGTTDEYLRLDGSVNQVNVYKTFDLKGNPIVAPSSITGNGGALNFDNPGELKLYSFGSNVLNLESSNGLNLTNTAAGPMVLQHQAVNNKIDFDSSLAPGAMVIESGNVGVLIQEASTGNNIGITSVSSGFVVNSGATNIRNTDATQNILIDKQNGGDINLKGNVSGFVNVQGSNLNLNSNNIVETQTISGTNGTVDFLNTPNQLKIGATPAANLLLESLVGQISINNKVVYIPDGQVLTSVNPNTTYIFLGTHTFTSTLTINQPGVVFRGVGRDNTKIQGSFFGPLIEVLDQDFEIADITLTASGDDTYALAGGNFAVGQPNDGRTKTLNMYNCQLRNCKNGMQITGFDLVDISQTLFYYFDQRSDALAQYGVVLRSCSKVEFTSCEFLRWFDESTFASPANFFIGDMLRFELDSGIAFGAVNLNANLFHPQQNQNGVFVDNAATFGFANITSCSFIDENLNTPAYLPLVIDIDLQPSWIIEANQGVPNYKAFINSEVDNNATVTTIAAPSTPTAVLASSFINNGSSRVTLNTSTGVITKDSKRSNYFSINLSGQFTIQTGGNNQDVEFGLFKNGAPSGPTTKVEADSNVGSNFTFNIIGFAEQGDTFQLYCQNNTGANNILVSNLQLAGVES